MGLDHHRVPPSTLRRKLAVECAELLADMHDTWIRAAVVRAFVDLEVGTLYELRSRLAGIPRSPERTPA